MPKKATSKKVYLAIILLVILVVATAAIVYGTQFSPKETTGDVAVGVKVGDTFTYKLGGESVLGSPDAVTPSSFSVYNDTDSYTVTITGINSTQVSMTTLWKLVNGTQFTSDQKVDVSNGDKTDQYGFWALYPSNLKIGALISPKGFDGITVNKTDTKTYADSTRTRNFFEISSQFRDINDPTGNTQRLEYDGVYFDKQTGMLDTLTNIQYYNNPQYNLIITWQLVGSNVWVVK